MGKHLLILSGGREISSGNGAEPAILALRLTRQVNEGSHLTPGSVCPAEVELTLLAQSAPVALGEEFRLYEETETGRRKLGTFTAESLQWLGTGRCLLTARDGLRALDRDLTGWLRSFAGGSLLAFARGVCAACGLTLKNETLLNGTFPVKPFTAAATGRQLMAWVGQLSGCFCRATPEGEAELGWYARRPSLVLTPGAFFRAGVDTEAVYEAGNLTLSPAARLTVLADDGAGHVTVGLDGGDRLGLPAYRDTMVPYGFAPPAIGQVRLRLNGETGVDYPASGENPYTVTGNPLLLGASEEALLAAAKGLLGKLRRLGCVPFRGQIPEGSGLVPGDVVVFRDRQGREGRTCVQSLVRQGGREDVACRSVLPEPEGRSLSKRIEGLTGKLLTVEQSLGGIRTTVTDLSEQGKTRYSELTQRADKITARVEAAEEQAGTRYSELTQRADKITARVEAAEEQAGTHYAELTQRADGLNVRVLSAERQGQALTGNITTLQQALAQKADKGALTEVQVTADGLSLAVSALQETAGGKADRTELQQVTEHFGFGEDGLRIYNSATGMGIRVSQEQVAFTGGADPTTVIRPSDMQTTNLRVGTRLELGDFSFFPRSNGNLSFRYTGETES